MPPRGVSVETMTRVFAHRGSSAAFPENTRAAYLQAIRDGADGIECDIHLSADGELVCRHDAVLGRTESARGEVRRMSLARLRELDVVSWKKRRIPAEYGTVQEQVCTLTDLLQIAASAPRPIEVAIETKHQLGDDPRLEAAMTRVLDELGFERATASKDHVSLSFMSFEPTAVQRLSGDWGSRAVCQLLGNKRRGWESDVLRGHGTKEVSRYATQFVQGVANLNRSVAGIAGPGLGFVRQHQEEFLAWLPRHTARVWTVDRPKDAAYLVGLGVTELTSNVPARIKEASAAQRLRDR